MNITPSMSSYLYDINGNEVIGKDMAFQVLHDVILKFECGVLPLVHEDANNFIQLVVDVPHVFNYQKLKFKNEKEFLRAFKDNVTLVKDSLSMERIPYFLEGIQKFIAKFMDENAFSEIEVYVKCNINIRLLNYIFN